MMRTHRSPVRSSLSYQTATPLFQIGREAVDVFARVVVAVTDQILVIHHAFVMRMSYEDGTG
jgi:hypothetical protein